MRSLFHWHTEDALLLDCFLLNLDHAPSSTSYNLYALRQYRILLTLAYSNEYRRLA